MEQYKVVITAEAKTDLQRYRDYLLYKIVKNIVYVTNMFHSLEDFEDKLK